jgi:phage replication-related protein YjqB (UPF0714/DUF867 family)
LAAGERAGTDYEIRVLDRPHAPALIIAPHGGSIEIGTSELAGSIAGADYSLFTFDGHKPFGRNRDLHITSHRFDHPECLTLAARHAIVLSVHGCKGDESRIYVGGLDEELSAQLEASLTSAGFPATAEGHRYPGRNPLNICNRGARSRGAQLEFTRDLRIASLRDRLASTVRVALADHALRVTTG